MNTRMIETIDNRITLKHIPTKIPRMNRTFIWIKSYKDLPNDVVLEIDKFLKNNEIIERGCWYNSHHVSFEVDGVSVVNGWYGEKITSSDPYFSELEQLRNLYPHKRFVKPDHDLIFDLKWNLVYTKHSWNKYGDHHFCLTTEIDTENKSFYVFKEFERYTGSSIKKNKMVYPVYKNIISNVLKRGINKGLRVLNSHILNDSNKKSSRRFGQILQERNLV